MTVEEAKGFTCRTAWTEAASPWYGVVGRPPLGMGWMGTCAIRPGGATGGALRLLDRQRDAVSHFLTACDCTDANCSARGYFPNMCRRGALQRNSRPR